MEVLRYAGFAEESSFAVSPAPAAHFCVDETAASIEAGSGSELVYKGALGRAQRVHRPSFYSCEGDIEYAFDVRTIGWILKWALGGYVFSGAQAPYLHEIYGSYETFLPTFCARLGKDKINSTDFEHAFSGCALDSLQLEVKDGYTTAKLAVKAAKDGKANIMTRAAVESLLPTEYPLMFHEVTISRNNIDVSAKVTGLKLEIKNNIKSESGRSLGSRFARRMPAGSREVAFSLDMYYIDLDTLNLLWGGSSGPVTAGSTEVPLTITFNAGTGGSIVLTMPRCIFTKVPLPVKGQDPIDLSADGEAFEDEILLADDVTTVETEILASITNDQAEMTIGGS